MTSSSISISLSPTPTTKPRHFSLSRTFFTPPTPTTSILNLKHHHPFHLSPPPLRLSLLGERNSRVRVRVGVIRGSVGGINVPSTLKLGGVVESDKLPSDVRKRAMEAIDELGGRVTIGDVSSKAGLKLNQAQTALQALAADTDGFLEVSDEGDVLYVFPKDFRSKLAAKSLKMKIGPWAEKAKLNI